MSNYDVEVIYYDNRGITSHCQSDKDAVALFDNYNIKDDNIKSVTLYCDGQLVKSKTKEDINKSLTNIQFTTEELYLLFKVLINNIRLNNTDDNITLDDLSKKLKEMSKLTDLTIKIRDILKLEVKWYDYNISIRCYNWCGVDKDSIHSFIL